MKWNVIVLLLLAQMGFSQDKKNTNLGDFDAVAVFDKISVQLIPSTENKIEISGKNFGEVELINKNGELKVRMPIGKLLKGDDVTALLYFKKIESIEANEGSYISCEKTFKQLSLILHAKEGSSVKLKLDVKKADIRLATGAIMELEGMAVNQNAAVSSGANLRAEKLHTEQTTVNVNAGGSADIRASELVDAKVRAGGNITIFGKPKQINQKTVLGGSINESNR